MRRVDAEAVEPVVRPAAAAAPAPGRSPAPRRSRGQQTRRADAVAGRGVEVLLGDRERHLASRLDGRPRRAPGPVRSRTPRWPACRPRSARPAAPGSPPAGAGGRSSRRTPAGSSGRRCRCAAAARRGAARRRPRSTSIGSSSSTDRQQRREVPHVLLEQVEDRGDPALAEPHARPYPLGLQLVRPGVGGLLEQRDPGLGPEPPAEQVRRVRADRHLDRGDRLRRRSSSRRTSSGVTCRWNCTLVQAASGAIESVQARSRSHAPDVERRCPRRGRRRSAR